MLNISIINSDGKKEIDFINDISKRNDNKSLNVESVVNDIIKNVKNNGDEALCFYAKKFDGVDISKFEIPYSELVSAYSACSIKDSLEKAANNIREYHEKQKRSGFVITGEGTVIGQRIRPLKRVGIYVPGGTAAYPSSVLMNAIPAKIAGVDEIVMVTPPSSEQARINILAAAYIAGVNRVFSVGGAQAVAALAYGTESIPKVDKIVGPGNIYVATAKKMLYGTVDIDMIAGPSEIMIIADESAKVEFLAADMLSQAEHDKLASSVLICSSIKKAELVRDELEKQLALLPRRDFAVQALETSGGIIVSDINHAIELANMFAPEHLELAVNNPFDYLHLIENAGSVFLGIYSPEPLGDYLAGPNHVLPTSGTARFFSPLSVDDFVKKYSFTYYNYQALERVKDDIIDIAEQEGLTAHANSIRKRFDYVR